MLPKRFQAQGTDWRVARALRALVPTSVLVYSLVEPRVQLGSSLRSTALAHRHDTHDPVRLGGEPSGNSRAAEQQVANRQSQSQRKSRTAASTLTTAEEQVLEGGIIWLETLIELKFIDLSFSSVSSC